MTSMITNKIFPIICSLLIFLFVYTALSKLLDFERFRSSLQHSLIPENFRLMTAWSLPVIELTTALLLFLPKTQVTGLRISFALMCLFTIYVADMILFSPHLPCSCGGIISSLSWKQHLIVNIFFTLLALAGMALKGSEVFIRINRKSRTPA